MNNNIEQNDLIEKYKKIDFSASNRNKDKNFKKLLDKLEAAKTNTERDFVNKKTRKPVYALVAVMTILLSFTMIVYGQDAIRFVKEIFIGNNARFSSDIERDTLDYTIPEEFAGKVYDKDGNPLDEYPKDFDDYIKIYNEAGEQVFTNQDSTGNILLTEEEHKQKTAERRENMTTSFNTLEEANTYFKYDYLTPVYLPEGYTFAWADIYNTDDGTPQSNTKAMDIYYSNGKVKISMNLRFMDEETAFELGGLGDLTEMSVNGYSAVKIGKTMLAVEIDSIMYLFNRNDDSDVSMDEWVSMDEIIRMAESLRK